MDKNNTVVWVPTDELEDPANLKSPLEEFKKSGMQQVVLDLTAKEWLTSSEIGAVMWVFKELEALKAKLCLVAVSPFVLKTVKLTGIDQLLEVFDSRESALNQTH